MIFQVGGQRLVFEEPEGQNAAQLKENNLYIEGLWSMEDTVGRPEVCVLCKQTGEDSFAFTTFSGLRFEMRVRGGQVEQVSRKAVK